MQVFGPLTPGSASSQEVDFGIVREYGIKEPTLKGYVFPTPDEALIRERYEYSCTMTINSAYMESAFHCSGAHGRCDRWKRC